jgi:hypothetical protein
MSESSASYAAVMAVTRRASRQAGGRGSPRGISKTFPILLPLNRLNDPSEWGQWLTVRWCGEAVQLSCVVRYLCFSDVVRAATGTLWPDSDDRTRDAIDSVLGAESAADGLRTESSPD